MIRVVERLQSMKMSGTRVPSAEESERAAAVFVDKYYTEERRRLLDDADRQHLEASYGNFRKYLENSADLTGLGEALLQLAQVSRLGKMAHALRSVAVFAAVRRAGGHSDRSRFDWEVGGIVPLCLQERASTLKLRNLRSDVFLCFAKLLGDVPGAFQANGRRRRQVRPRKSNFKNNANNGEPSQSEAEPGIDEPYC